MLFADWLDVRGAHPTSVQLTAIAWLMILFMVASLLCSNFTELFRRPNIKWVTELVLLLLLSFVTIDSINKGLTCNSTTRLLGN